MFRLGVISFLFGLGSWVLPLQAQMSIDEIFQLAEQDPQKASREIGILMAVEHRNFAQLLQRSQSPYDNATDYLTKVSAELEGFLLNIPDALRRDIIKPESENRHLWMVAGKEALQRTKTLIGDLDELRKSPDLVSFLSRIPIYRARLQRSKAKISAYISENPATICKIALLDIKPEDLE